jgi:alkylation response protein AidB-like acyl-CoA dehydrogenase
MVQAVTDSSTTHQPTVAHGISAQCESLVEQARAVGPLLSKYADYGDENLHLADEVVNELVDRQLFRLWQPRRYDGLEVDVLTQMVVTSELATPCAIACWSC